MPRTVCSLLVVLAVVGSLGAEAKGSSPSVAHADSLYMAGARDLARHELDRLIGEAESRGDSLLLRDALLSRGRQAAGVGRAREASPDLERAEALARRTDADGLARRALRWWGYAQLTLGALDPARAIYDRLLAESLESSDRYHEAHAEFGLAYLDLHAGRRRLARERYQRAVDLFGELDQPRDQLYVLVGLALVLTADGDVASARKVYDEILARSRELDLLQPAAQALNNLAVLEFELGSADRAVENFQAAAQLYATTGEVAEALGVTTNLSVCLIQLGRFGEAEALLDSTLQQADAGGYRDRIVRLLVYRADLARARREPALAEGFLARALDLSDPRDVSRRLDIYRARANLRAVADPAVAAAELERDSRPLRALASDVELADLELGLARLFLASGAVVAGRDAAQNSVDLAAGGAVPLTRLPALVLLAQAERKLGEQEEAASSLREALATWESVRGTPRDPEWRERWGALSRSLSSEFVARLSGEVPPSEAEVQSTFAILQRFKARTFIERLTGFGGLAGGDSLRTETMARLTDLAGLQSLLADDEMVLDLHEGPNGPICFVITRDRLDLHRVPDPLDLSRRIPLLWEIASTRPASPDTAPADLAIATWLREFLSPLTEAMRRRPRILMSPTGVWHAAPWEAIDALLPELGTQLSRIPSPQVLFELRTRRVAREADDPATSIQGLLIASSSVGERALPGSLDEARELADKWSNLVTRIDEPIEPEELSRVQWLHFAMHATADPQRPWNSSLQLQRGDGELQELNAYEVLSLPLDLRLCVLSACQSASAQILPGEGMLGLASAFLIAGSDTVVAAMWNVDDAATARFMEEFYEALGDGQNTAGALREARRAIQRDPATAHPYYWAGFCLVGDPSTGLTLQRGSPPTLATLLILLGILSVGAVILRRKRTP